LYTRRIEEYLETNDWMLDRYPPIDDPVLIDGEVPILFPISGRDLPQYPIRSLCVRVIEFTI